VVYYANETGKIYNATCTVVDDDGAEVTSQPVSITVITSSQEDQESDQTSLSPEQEDEETFSIQGEDEGSEMTVQSQSSSQAQTEAQDKEAQDSSAIRERKIIVHEVTMKVVGCTIAPHAPFSLDFGLLFGVPVIYLCSRYFRRSKFSQNFAKYKKK